MDEGGVGRNKFTFLPGENGGIEMEHFRRLIVIVVIIGLTGISFAGTYSGGTGTAEDPYQIADANDLLELGATTGDYDKHFIMTADIDLDGYTFERAVIAWDANNELGFQGTSFEGVFDGRDFIVKNLHCVSSGENYIGLFGNVGNDADIKDLRLIDINIDAGSGNYVGCLCGYNNGKISYCSVIGTVSGGFAVGGLCGESYRNAITNCHANVSVEGNDTVGGLCGNFHFGGLWYSYAIGNVVGNFRVGGLVGATHLGAGHFPPIRSFVVNCYATGNVKGNHYVGGLVGDNHGYLWYCYSSGYIEGTTIVGGLIGTGSMSDIQDCFWNIDEDCSYCADPNTCDELAECDLTYGKITAEMKQQSTFTDWDFINIWNIGENQTYPYLRKNLAADINKDYVTNLLDLSILAENWLQP